MDYKKDVHTSQFPPLTRTHETSTNATRALRNVVTGATTKPMARRAVKELPSDYRTIREKGFAGGNAVTLIRKGSQYDKSFKEERAIDRRFDKPNQTPKVNKQKANALAAFTTGVAVAINKGRNIRERMRKERGIH